MAKNNLVVWITSVFGFGWTLLKIVAKIWLFIGQSVGTVFLIFSILGIFLIQQSGKVESGDLGLKKGVLVQAGSATESIAVVKLNGEIVSDATESLMSGAQMIDVTKTEKLLRQLKNDAAIKAVVISINSPGGAVVASDRLYQAIKDLNDAKPVVVQLEDVAASGGYYAAVAGSNIIAHPATITGSIGVIMQSPEFTELFEKVGISVRTIKSGQFKDIGSSTKKMEAEDKAILQTIVTEAYDRFVSIVADERGLEMDKAREIADGRIYTGQQAAVLGLVDSLGDRNDAIAIASLLAGVENPSIWEYGGKTWLSAFLDAKATNFSLTSLVPNSNLSRQAGLWYLASW